MTTRFAIPALLCLVLLSSFAQQLIVPQHKRDDLALMKYFAHATAASSAMMIASATEQHSDANMLARYNLRIKTSSNYPLSTLLTKWFDHILGRFAYAGVIATFALTSGIALIALLYLRRSFPSPYAGSIDLALLFVAIGAMLDYHGLVRAFPFGGGPPWFDIFPRGAIQLMFIGYLYVHVSDASRRTKLVVFASVACAGLVLNALYAAMIIGLLLCFAALRRAFGTIRFEYLFPVLFAIVLIVFIVYVGIMPQFVTRAALWFGYTCVLLYMTRHLRGSIPRDLCIFFASVTLATYFFGYDFINRLQADLFQIPIRTAGLSQFAFFLLLSFTLTEKYRRYALALIGTLIALFLLWEITQGPVTMLRQPLPTFEIVPSYKDETGFIQYFTRYAIDS